MKIKEIFEQKSIVFSLEVFPPKKSSDISTIYNTLDQLADTNPDFISVTYGAGGTDAGKLTSVIVSKIKNEYHVEPLAHLTGLYNSKEQVIQILEDLKQQKIENILALRGDKNPDLPVCHDFTHSCDLARFISDNYDFDLAGACYPETHPDSISPLEDIMNLRHKVDAGVSHLITQLFFNNDDFYNFNDRLAYAGISVPVEAGIMPVINSKQIKRIVSMCGASLPAKFTKMISRYEDNPDALFDAGIAYATDQIVDLISNGVRGIHLYTMNNPAVAHKIYRNIKTILNATNTRM